MGYRQPRTEPPLEAPWAGPPPGAPPPPEPGGTPFAALLATPPTARTALAEGETESPEPTGPPPGPGTPEPISQVPGPGTPEGAAAEAVVVGPTATPVQAAAPPLGAVDLAAPPPSSPQPGAPVPAAVGSTFAAAATPPAAGTAALAAAAATQPIAASSAAGTTHAAAAPAAETAATTAAPPAPEPGEPPASASAGPATASRWADKSPLARLVGPSTVREGVPSAPEAQPAPGVPPAPEVSPASASASTAPAAPTSASTAPAAPAAPTLASTAPVAPAPVAPASAPSPAPVAPTNPPSPGAPVGSPAAGLGAAPSPAAAVEATIRLAATQGFSRARLTLKPAELGHVEVVLRSAAGGVTASLLADTPEAARLLEAAAPDLRRRLESQGVELLNLAVTVADGSAAGAGREGAPGRGTGRPTGSGHAPLDESQTPTRTIELSDGVLIDVLA